MRKVVSLRLQDDQIERLQRAARRLGRTPSEAAALLLEEALRQRDFTFIEFRDSPVGRQAYVQGTRLAVWQIAALARDFGADAAKIAAHLELPVMQMTAALGYAVAYPSEIEAALADQAQGRNALEHLIPMLETVTIDAPAS
ncbi:MAG: transcriptional regulator [Chloroflexi bacterium]|nr:transcriptional regulator [Chloroflexota bacterium]